MKKEVLSDSVTIYCRDCLEILPTLGKACIDCIITDPPYGHNNNNNDLIHNLERALGKSSEIQEGRAIINDGEEANEIFRKCLPLFLALLRHGCCCCCCCGGGGGTDPQFARWSLWMDEVFNFKQMVVWDKGPMGMGWHYRRSYETVLVGEKPGAPCKWYGGNNKENIIRPGQYGIRKIIPSAEQHPCAKPVELYRHFIGLHTAEGDTVLDPFMGDGPCGVAALEMGRKFIGIEIDEKYYEVAKRRLENELAQLKLF
jgi:site-specific DNA-methyltransferase (adenine-specific)